MKFTKIQGCGNDYLFVDLTGGRTLPGGVEGAPELARRMSDRRFGAGSDGLILVTDPPAGSGADAGMIMFNADGSRGAMCGNGFRGLCKLVHERGIARKPEIRVMTDAGMRTGAVHLRDGRVESVTVDMGVPGLNRGDLPMEGPAGPAIESRIKAAGREIVGTAVSMGNPHFVVFVEGDVDGYPVESVGPAVESHRLFPHRVNAEFVQVLSRNEVRQRTWERGSGETLACGTGAAAVLVAGVVTERLASPLTVHLRGGDLLLEWGGKGTAVFKTGPTVEVYEGEWPA
ncbi:MAG: diaminopimelate epimerase [Planctomycetes bacterium]|nr:diaminopimelate epimerase [Planctomycetota bacterium]